MIDLVYVRENFDVDTRNTWLQTAYVDMTAEGKALWNGTDAWLSCTDGYLSCTDGNITFNGQSVIYGAYNAVDMNRVESAVQTLSAALVAIKTTIDNYLAANDVAPDEIFELPYDPEDYDGYTVKTNWSFGQIPGATDRARYISNVADIITAISNTYPTLPNTLNALNTTGANAIEEALHILDVSIADLEAEILTNIDHAALSFWYSDEVMCGEV